MHTSVVSEEWFELFALLNKYIISKFLCAPVKKTCNPKLGKRLLSGNTT